MIYRSDRDENEKIHQHYLSWIRALESLLERERAKVHLNGAIFLVGIIVGLLAARF